MSAEAQAAAGHAGESMCWCCGRASSEDALVHLGNHPEVGICVNCVRFLQRRARDAALGQGVVEVAEGADEFGVSGVVDRAGDH